MLHHFILAHHRVVPVSHSAADFVAHELLYVRQWYALRFLIIAIPAPQSVPPKGLHPGTLLRWL